MRPATANDSMLIFRNKFKSMNQISAMSLLSFYGIFLILCGIVSVIFIGMKAKTALLSGGTSGVLSLLIAYLISIGVPGAVWMGAGLCLALLVVFCWRTAMTLFKVFELVPTGHPDLRGKGIAFLIISLMAVVSMFVVFLLLLTTSTQYLVRTP